MYWTKARRGSVLGTETVQLAGGCADFPGAAKGFVFFNPEL